MRSEPAGGDGPGAAPMHFIDKLIPATIVSRPNRFVFEVSVPGQGTERCHCPTTGRVGDFVPDGLPCLLSRAQNPTRTTRYTVEALSLDADPAVLAHGSRTWIGINQNAANRYVETALRAGLLSEMIDVDSVRREVGLGDSRIDFLVNGSTYLEVKTPLETIQLPVPDSITRRRHRPLDSTTRLARHITTLGEALGDTERAILVICFQYPNPGFVVTPSAHHDSVGSQVRKAIGRGVEIWQLNLAIDPTGVQVSRVADLTPAFRS